MRAFCVEQRVIRNYHAFTDHATYPLPWIEHFLVYPNNGFLSILVVLLAGAIVRLQYGLHKFFTRACKTLGTATSIIYEVNPTASVSFS